MAKRRTRSELNEKRSDDERLAEVLLHPTTTALMVVTSLYDSTPIHDQDGKATNGLQMAALAKALHDQLAALKDGDMRQVEELLLTQAISLDKIFAVFLSKAISAEYVSQVDIFTKIALKAQNQARQTLATLGELKNPRRSTFIGQQNNAHNQQINQGKSIQKSATQNSKNSGDRENKLLEVSPSERLDVGTTQTPSQADTAMATVDEIDGATDTER